MQSPSDPDNEDEDDSDRLGGPRFGYSPTRPLSRRHSPTSSHPVACYSDDDGESSR